jgi:hypothetical protein
MIRYLSIFFKVFAGAYVHTPINLTGVCGDDFARKRQLMCKIHGIAGFAGCRWTENANELGFAGKARIRQQGGVYRLGLRQFCRQLLPHSGHMIANLLKIT